MDFGTVAFNVKENPLKDQIRTVEHYKRFDGDFVVEVLMLWLFVLVEFKFKVVAVLLNQFLVGLLLKNFEVLNDDWFNRGWVHVDFLLLLVFVLGFLLFLMLMLSIFLLILMISLIMFPMMVLVVMVPLNYIFLFKVLSEFFLFDLDFLFEFYLPEVLVLQFELGGFIIFFKTVLEKLQRVKHIMLFVILVQHAHQFTFVGLRNRLVQYFKMSSFLRIKLLVDFQVDKVLLERKMQVHLLIKQQGSQVNEIHFGFVFRVQFKRILVPPDDLVVLLVLFGGKLFQELKEGLFLEVFLLYFLDLFFDFGGFAVVGETLGVLFEELQFVSACLFELLEQFLFHLDAGFGVQFLLLCLCLRFRLSFSLLLLERFLFCYFPLGLLLFVDEVPFELGLEVPFMFFGEFLVFFFFLLGGVEKLAVLAFPAEAGLNPKLTGFFGLLLVHEGAVFLDAFASCVVPANFSSVLSLHD